MARTENVIEFQLDEPATPQRVAAAATFVSRLLDVAHPNLPDGSVTLVVTNFLMGTGVRARTPTARAALGLLTSFLVNPMRTLDKHPQTSGFAAVLADPGAELCRARILRPRGKTKLLATLDEQYTKRMRALANADGPQIALRGTTVIYSPVLRVGRISEERTVRARIRINGTFHEISVKDERASAFFDAAKTTQIYPIKIATAWRRLDDGKLSIDTTQTKCIGIDLTWSTVSGAEFVRLAQESAPSGFDEDDVAERLAKIRARQ